jgi:hypothetical protein
MNSQIVSSKKRFPLVVSLVLAGLFFVMVIIVVVLFNNPTAAFSLQLDGKPLPLGVIPVVTMNGKPFHNGDKLSVGHNSLSIMLNNAEPISRNVWTWWGENNLGSISLNTLKGNLSLTTAPSAVMFALRQGSDSIRSGITPVTLKDVPVGDYDVLISRGSYKEGKAVTIVKGETASLNLNLKIADILLESSPTDADFTLTGNGNKWEGKLPTVISNVTFGNYTCTSSRKGWKIVSSITVDRTGGLTNLTEFPYGSIEVTSDPTGLLVSNSGDEIGKTPLTVRVKPGQYTLTASDGENDLIANVDVAQNEAAKHAFIFHYGAVQLSSTPAGATVVRKGKEVGKTPLALNHIPVGESSIELRLDGYKSTNLIVGASEGTTVNFSVKLISEQYLQAMKKAHVAFDAGQFADARIAVTAALAVEPNDPDAAKLQAKIAEAEQNTEKARLQAEQQAAAERRPANERRFQQLIASTKNARIFPNYTRTYSSTFNNVWDSTLNVLKQQKEQSIRSNAETGIITTIPTEHSALLFLSLHKNQYLIFIEQNGNNTTTINLDLISFFADFNNGSTIWRQMSSEFLQQMVNDFFGKIGKSLNKESETFVPTMPITGVPSAANTMNKISDYQVEKLCEELEADNPRKVIDALKKLRNMKATEAAPRILPCLAHSNPNVIREACRTLAIIGNKDAVPAIEPLLTNARPDIIREACRTLAVIGNKDAIPAIEPLLTNARPDIVREACRTLAVIGNKEIIPAIEPLLTNSRPDIRKDAQNAIEKLQAKP